jgi:hypothetical protein
VPQAEKWVPYRLMREWASTIDPDDVECLKFGGPQMGGFIGYDPIIVFDRRLIRRFLDALKQASLPAPPPGKKALATTMGIDVMMICFRPKGRERRRTETVMFFPLSCGKLLRSRLLQRAWGIVPAPSRPPAPEGACGSGTGGGDTGE